MTVKRISVEGEWYEVSGQGYNPEGKYLRDGKALAAVTNGSLKTILLCGALCNDAILEEERKDGNQTWKIIDDPTEGAMVAAGQGRYE